MWMSMGMIIWFMPRVVWSRRYADGEGKVVLMIMI